MEHVLNVLFDVPPAVAYVLVGLLAFGESVFLLGFVLPGEAAVLVGGLLASHGRVSLAAMLVLAAAGAVVGDAVSFSLGRRFGPRLLDHPRVRRHQSRVEQLKHLMGRRGASTVVLGRFTAYLRPLVPAVAGITRMGRARFVLANVAGGVVWATSFTLIGFVAGDAYHRVASVSQWAGLGLIVAAVAVALLVRRHKRGAGDQPRPPALKDSNSTLETNPGSLP